MRRSAVKSRVDKLSRTDSISVITAAAAAPAAASSITVPRLLTESSWTNMITHEEGEEVVMDIIAELMDGVMNRCFQVYLQKHLVPFSVWWARNNLLQTLECLFLVRDEEDDPETESFWKEDSEPQPGAIDSWAEGCVPVVHDVHN